MTSTHIDSPADRSPGRGFVIALWTAQIVLAFVFGAVGASKALQPTAGIGEALSPGLVQFIGASELLAVLGLILPSVTRIRPFLIPIAAAALVLVMVLAAMFHLSRGEFSAIAVNAVLGSLAAFVAWGRSRKAPIAPRGTGRTQ